MNLGKARPLAVESNNEETKRDEAVLVSSGGVLFRKDGDTLKVCIIAKRKMRVWALPRGRVESGETPPETAQREVREETGFYAKVLEKIDEIDFYFYSKTEQRLYYRIVHFYLMEYLKGDIKHRDKEADAVRWFSIDEAIDKLRYENEKEILRKAKKILYKRFQIG